MPLLAKLERCETACADELQFAIRPASAFCASIAALHCHQHPRAVMPSTGFAFDVILEVMFRIKLCGVMHPHDARLAADAGADAIGLNFYSGSPRSIDADHAHAIVAAIKDRVSTVGVFVNSASADVLDAFRSLSLSMVQLHGDEPPEFLRELQGIPVIRAFRVGGQGLPPVVDYLNRCRALRCSPQGVLLDAFSQGRYGGTGATANWDLARDYRQLSDVPPLILAGGLNPGNVALAIQSVQPQAVDVASGVESAPGKKEPGLVRRFVEEARSAFTTTNASI